jgi:integrase
MAAEERTGSTPPLTPKLIEATPPRERDFELADPAAPGLRLRITPKGGKTFRWYVTSLGRVITIGRWTAKPRPGFVTLGEARTWLERLKEAHRGGRLGEVLAELAATRPPKSAKLREEPGSTTAVTVRAVADAFFAFLERERKRPEQGRRPLEYDILPAIGERQIATVTRQECRAIVEAVVARGSPVQAGVVLGVMKQFFRFAVDRGDLDASPAECFRNPRALGVVKNMSQRYLSADEIGAFWRALDTYKGITPTVRNGLRVLLLTGVRSGELLHATWEEVDLQAATWTIPVAHQKLTRERERTARPWTVPLAPTALRLFEELRALAASVGSLHVMASFHAAGGHISEKALNHAMRRLFVGKHKILSFAGERPTPHDLRRTMRTHLGDTLGVPWHIAERCLNHAIGTITATYDVGDYVKERRAALEKWDAYLGRLVAPEQSKVAFLPAAGA